MRRTRRQNQPLSTRSLLKDKGLESLVSETSLESLMEMLFARDRLRKRIHLGPLGPRVTDFQEASRSLGRIMAVTEQILCPALVDEAGPGPRMVLDDRLSRLKSETTRSFVAFSSLALGLLAACTPPAWPSGRASLPVAGSGLSLLAISFSYTGEHGSISNMSAFIKPTIRGEGRFRWPNSPGSSLIHILPMNMDIIS